MGCVYACVCESKVCMLVGVIELVCVCVTGWGYVCLCESKVCMLVGVIELVCV